MKKYLKDPIVIISVLTFFGISGVAALVDAPYKIAGHLAAPTMREILRDTVIYWIPLQRARSDSITKVTAESQREYMDKRFDALEELLAKVPEVKRALEAEAHRRRQQDRERRFRHQAFGHPQ